MFTRSEVVVKVLAVDGIPPQKVTPFYCHSSDLSIEGIRLVLDRELPPGAQVELIVVLLDPPASFRHMGVVRWHKASAEGQNKFAGIEFTASSPAVMAVWKRVLTERYPMISSMPAQRFAKDPDSAW